MAIEYGRVTHPPHEKHIVSKPAHTGSAWGYIWVPQGRKIVGSVEHQTGGRNDTPQGIYNLFGPGGERYDDALTDYVTGKDGTLWMLNEPRGNRAGWANGGGVGSPGGLEGDGPAFYSKYGSWGVDTMLVSNENCSGFDEQNFTPQQYETIAKLEAYWHDQAKCPWDTYPLNPNAGNVVQSFLHYEFGTTSCGKLRLDDAGIYQAKAAEIMRLHQTGQTGPVTPDVPPQPEPEIPGGITLAQATERFGKLKVHLPDGKTVLRGFDPKGPISIAWARRAAEEKLWPAADQSWFLPDTDGEVNVVTFKGGWILLKRAPRASWAWV